MSYQFSSPASVFLLIRAFQKRWVSLTVLMAKSYRPRTRKDILKHDGKTPSLLAVRKKSLINVVWMVALFTLFLNSPSKANWFSGLPSGTLYIRNQSSVACRYPGFSLRTSSISASDRRCWDWSSCSSQTHQLKLSDRWSLQPRGPPRLWPSLSSRFLPRRWEPESPTAWHGWLLLESRPEAHRWTTRYHYNQPNQKKHLLTIHHLHWEQLLLY